LKIKVYQKDIQETFVKSIEQLWRSLESFLERHQRKFYFNEVEKSVEIEVADEADARRLMDSAGVRTYTFVSKEVSKTVQPVKKKPGRPKNTVRDHAAGQAMTVKQYNKHMKQNSLSKTEIVKRGILSKAQLDTAIANNELSVMMISGSHRISQESLHEYLNNL
jgi:predicted transcriptional regulator